MNTNDTIRRHTPAAPALAALAGLIWTFTAAAPASAGFEPEPFRTALFGVTDGQTVEVSIVNTGDEVGIIAPCTDVFDAAGELLAEIPAREPLRPGEGIVFEIPASLIGEGRSSVRIEVELEGADRRTETDRFLVGVEVVDDDSGSTIIDVDIFDFNPQPEPPKALQ